METETYHFQDPASGSPLILTTDHHNLPVVEATEDLVDPLAEKSVKDMNRGIINYQIRDIHQAARLLARRYDCKDILF
jgi:hypothetical protein